MKKIFSLLLALAIFTPAVSFAQNIDLTPTQKEEIQDRAAQKIEAFLMQLQYVASKSSGVQDEAIKSTLALFLEKGEPYYDTYGNYNDGVKMQTATLRKNRHGKPIYNRPILMKRYLNNMRGQVRYDNVQIDQVGVVRVDNLRKVGEGKYEGMAYFLQAFRGERDGRLIYGDKTEKSVKIYVQLIDVGMGTTWQVYLGDMKVRSISKL